MSLPIKPLVLFCFLFLANGLRSQHWISFGVEAHAGLSKSHTTAAGNNVLAIKPQYPLPGTGIGLLAGYHKEDGLSIDLGYHTVTYNTAFTDIQTKSRIQQLQFSERLICRTFTLQGKKYFKVSSDFDSYALLGFGWNRNIRKDSTNGAVNVIVDDIRYEAFPIVNKQNFYLKPEWGLSYSAGEQTRIEAGVSYRIGVGKMLTGTYNYTDHQTQILTNTNGYSMSSSGFAFYVRVTQNIFELKKIKRGKDTLQHLEGMAINRDNIPETVHGRKVQKQGNVKVNREYVDLYIWDGGTQDGDSISLCMNGEWILKDYPLSKEKKVIRVQLRPGENNYLVLYALNMGKVPPNSALISYKDGLREIRLRLQSTLDKCGAINFLYDEPE